MTDKKLKVIEVLIYDDPSQQTPELRRAIIELILMRDQFKEVVAEVVVL